MSILLIGANGQLGSSFKKLSKKSDDIKFFTKNELDICDKCSLKKIISKYSPNIIINCSAYTNVEKAEDEKALASKINSNAIKNIGELCYQNNIHLFHFSTDYVFDGKSKAPYKEDDKTNPINHYGYSKLKGEEHILDSKCKHTIIRTSWVFSEFGRNFIKTIYNISKKNSVIDIIDDQIGNPTYAIDLAYDILEIIRSKKYIGNYGVFNYTNNISCSWAEFAYIFFTKMHELKKISDIPLINKVSHNNFITKAKRPAYSVLDNSKFCKVFKTKSPDLIKAIHKTAAKL